MAWFSYYARAMLRETVSPFRNLFFGGWNGASLPAGHPYLCGLICVHPALPACPFGLNEGESVRMYSLVLPVVLAQAWLY
jgi:hypothetical protein